MIPAESKPAQTGHGSRFRLYLGGVCSAVGFGTALNVLILNTPLPALSPGFQQVAEKEAEAPLVWGVVLFCFLAPLLEEFIFRFLLCLLPEHFLRKSISPKAAGRLFIFFSAFVFALAHGNIVQGLYAFCMGVLLAVFALKARNPGISFLMHMFSNLTVYLISALGFGSLFLNPLTGLFSFALGLFGLWQAFPGCVDTRNKKL